LPFYDEHEGERFCVLHFPSANKEDEFRKALQNKLEQRDFNFEGIYFPEWLRYAFAKSVFDTDVSFDNATFCGAMHFTEAQFKGERATFRAAQFSGESIDFTKAQFSGWTEFTEAKFSSGFTNFREAQFSGERTNFTKAQFSGERTIFAEAQFSGWTDRLLRSPIQ